MSANKYQQECGNCICIGDFKSCKEAPCAKHLSFYSDSIEQRHAELVELVERWKKAHNAMRDVYNTPADTEEEARGWNAEWERRKPVLDAAESALRDYGREIK